MRWGEVYVYNYCVYVFPLNTIFIIFFSFFPSLLCATLYERMPRFGVHRPLDFGRDCRTFGGQIFGANKTTLSFGVVKIK